MESVAFARKHKLPRLEAQRRSLPNLAGLLNRHFEKWILAVFCILMSF